MSGPDVLTIPQAARRLGKAAHTLRRLIDAGDFPIAVIELGRRRYVSVRGLDEFINGSTIASTSSSRSSAEAVEGGVDGAAGPRDIDGACRDVGAVNVGLSGGNRPAAPTSTSAEGD